MNLRKSLNHTLWAREFPISFTFGQCTLGCKILLVGCIDLCQAGHEGTDLWAPRPRYQSYIICCLNLCHTKQGYRWLKDLRVWFDLDFKSRSNLTSRINWPYRSSYYCITHFIRLSLLVKELQSTDAPIGTTLHNWTLGYKILLVHHIDQSQVGHGGIDLRAQRPRY